MLAPLCLVMCAQLSSAAVVTFTSDVLAADGSNATTLDAGTVFASQNVGGGSAVINGVEWGLNGGPVFESASLAAPRNGGNFFYTNSGVQSLNAGIAFNQTLTLNFTGLVEGQRYQLQFISFDSDAAPFGTDVADRLQTVSVTSVGSSGTLDYQHTFEGGVRSIENTRAALVTATWIQDVGSSTMDFAFAARGGNGDAVVSGWVLQETVPEPSSAALVGLAGITLLLRRRR